MHVECLNLKNRTHIECAQVLVCISIHFAVLFPRILLYSCDHVQIYFFFD